MKKALRWTLLSLALASATLSMTGCGGSGEATTGQATNLTPAPADGQNSYKATKGQQ